MDPAATGDFGSGSFRGPDDEHYESAHDGPAGASGGDHLSSGMLGGLGDLAVHDVQALVDAAASPLHFDPAEMDSSDDYDLNGDGVVDHHDAHSALHSLHDFHAPEHVEPDPHAHAPDPAHDPAHGFFHH
jgi:hypothetical protein